MGPIPTVGSSIRLRFGGLSVVQADWSVNPVEGNGGIIPLSKGGCWSLKLATSHRPHRLRSYDGTKVRRYRFLHNFPLSGIIVQPLNA